MAGVPRLHVSMGLAAALLDLRSGAVPAAASFLQQAGAVAWAPGAISGSVTVQLLNSGNLTVCPSPLTPTLLAVDVACWMKGCALCLAGLLQPPSQRSG